MNSQEKVNQVYRVVFALLIASFGVVMIVLGEPSDLDASETWRAAWLTVLGFLCLPAAMLALFGGKLPWKVARAFDLLTAVGSIIAIVLTLASSSNFINESRQRSEAQLERVNYAFHGWQVQQLVNEECHRDFGRRCAALRRVGRMLATEGGIPLPEDIDTACGLDPSDVANDPYVVDWLRSGCSWLHFREKTRGIDWSEIDSRNAALRQYFGTIILTALLGFSLMRTIFPSVAPTKLGSECTFSKSRL